MYTSVKRVHVAPPSGNVTLEYLNEELVQLHIPALVFIIVSMVIGIIGNALVMLVYKTKFRRSNHRYFILFLAFFDILACAFGMPFLVSSLRLPYMLDSEIVCKTMRYLSYTINNSSGLLLLVVSIERYRKICRPFKKQLNTNQILYLCFGVAFISAVVAIPAGIFYGASTIDTGVGNITGTQCYVEDARKGSPLFELYMLFLLLEALLCIVAFIVLYIFIIRKLLATDVFLSTMRNMQSTRSDSVDNTLDSLSTDNLGDGANVSIADSLDKESGCSDKPLIGNRVKDQTNAAITGNGANAKSNDAVVMSEILAEIKQANEDENDVSMNEKPTKPTKRPSSASGLLDSRINATGTKGDNPPQKWNTITPAQKLAYVNVIKDGRTAQKNKLKGPTKSTKSTMSSRKRSSKTTNRVTIMLFMVSIVFAISFVPHLVLMILAAHYKGFLENMTSAQIVSYQVFLRTFVLNNIANPLIYLYCDSKFRKSCFEIIRCKFRFTHTIRR